MADPIALILTRLDTTCFGLPSLVSQSLAGQCVLAHTVARVARVRSVRKIVLVHECERDPAALLEGRDFDVPVCSFRYEGESEPYQRKLAAARKWSLTAWRGGLGGAMCYDELLPAAPMSAAMEHFGAESALLVGADWPLVDSDYCQSVLDLHLAHPDEMKMTFTQAPPGLGGIALGRSLIDQLAKNHACLGQIVAYNPTKPQADPIGRDVCVAIPGSVRSCCRRFIYDTPATMKMIDVVANRLGSQVVDASAQDVCDVAASLAEDRTDDQFARLPQSITLELNTNRLVTGPITPQHHVKLQRSDMAVETAMKIVGQLGEDQDTVLTLGGLGDALLHPHWSEIVAAAHDAGVLGIMVETDLLIDEAILAQLFELPLDVVSVRLNADTTALYKKVMDPDDTLNDGFAKVLANLQALFNRRNDRTRELIAQGNTTGAAGLPWSVLRMVKMADTMDDLETFFDRWLHYGGQPVIEPATTGCDLMPPLSPVRMDPPGRFACRQMTRRMTIHADGRVARCDQDWLGRAAVGDATTTSLADLWQSLRSVRQAHADGQWDELALCKTCHEWHRP